MNKPIVILIVVCVLGLLFFSPKKVSGWFSSMSTIEKNPLPAKAKAASDALKATRERAAAELPFQPGELQCAIVLFNHTGGEIDYADFDFTAPGEKKKVPDKLKDKAYEMIRFGKTGRQSGGIECVVVVRTRGFTDKRVEVRRQFVPRAIYWVEVFKIDGNLVVQNGQY
jgi:hypothetical protein